VSFIMEEIGQIKDNVYADVASDLRFTWHSTRYKVYNIIMMMMIIITIDRN